MCGASAGGWRCLAMACRNPSDAYESLRVAYSRNVFNETDTPETVARALKSNVDAFLSDEDIPFILDHPHFDLAIHAIRSRSLAASAKKPVEGAALAITALLNAVHPMGMRLFYERAVFYSGKSAPTWAGRSGGCAVPLTERNIRQTALATGSLPYIVSGVKDIPAAPPGVYRDGGLINYQLNEDYQPGDGLTLFFHYQERIVPGWFDKPFRRRIPTPAALERTLQVYPSREFVRMLPNCRIPDRHDFITYVNDPEKRIAIWDEVCETSELLAEEFAADLKAGVIGDYVKNFSEPNP